MRTRGGGLDTWKGLKPLEPVVRFTQSNFALLLELSVFLFQFFDATVFGEDHQVLTHICFARKADVARMTVYHQFGSKIGLLEALSDSLAAHGGMEQLANAFRQPEPFDALDEYISVFSRFWDSDRLVTRRLRALAALDPDFEQVVRARDERRRQGLRVIVGHLVEKHGQPAPGAFDETVDVLYTLLSFESFDTLAGPTRTIEEVAPIVSRLTHAVLGLSKG